MLALALTVALHAATFEDYDSVRTDGNTAGLSALGIWGVSSTITGIVGLATTSDPRWKGVHVASLVWGVINIGFAVFGLYSGLTPSARRDNLADAYGDGRGMHTLYAINAAFDVGYLAAAALLLTHSSGDRVQGFAQGSLIQALWLFGFDGSMALFHQINNARAQ